MNILLCGYGEIGKQLKPLYDKMGDVTVYDPAYKKYSSMVSLFYHYDIAIICVPTPTVAKMCNTTIVNDMVHIVDADIIVIRSTVSVGFTKSLNKDNVVFWPEFTGTTQNVAKDDFAILCGKKEYTHKLAQLLYKCKPATKIIQYEDPTIGEIIKYTDNCFLATKVVFFNMIARTCKNYNVSYDDVRNGLLMDNRINPSHTIVFDDQPYYDSKCFNKDVTAFGNQTDNDLLQVVDYLNKCLREKYNEC